MLHCRLERVCATHLRVHDNEPDCPIDNDGESDQENNACGHSGLTECVRLTDDAGTAIVIHPWSASCDQESLSRSASISMCLDIPFVASFDLDIRK